MLELVRVTSPEKLVDFLQSFKHDFRYSTNLSKVNFDYLVKQYFTNNSLPSFTFVPTDLVLSSKKGSCYDLSLLSYKVLTGLGYKCDILHFGWTPKESTSLGIVSCMHTVCRYKSKRGWYTLHGFLYGNKVSILGPFSSVSSFAKIFSSIIEKGSKRDSISITFIDSLSFESKAVPSLLTRLYPVEKDTSELRYWLI